MDKDATRINNPEASGTSDNWEDRKLCSDGNCIGVIGPGGSCKECGKPYHGDPLENDPLWESDNGENGYFDQDDRENQENASEDLEDSDWENRKLCIDGNCIGTIGMDGRCKECGKPYESNA